MTLSNKEREAAYFRTIPPDALQQSLDKPFSTENRSTLLTAIAAVIAQMPPPPARVIDFGCGTGWTSAFFARCGYDVVGVDLSSDAILRAREFHDLPSLRFEQFDYDQAFPSSFGEFDVAVFFDSLHHSRDERLPLAAAYQSLVRGGVCVICEPGRGHSCSTDAVHAQHEFGVTERDMPPRLVIETARSVGFTSWRVLPHPDELFRNAYLPRRTDSLRDRILASAPGLVVRMVRVVTLRQRDWGLVRLVR